MKYALAYDIGTTGVKTCLFEIGSNIRLIAGESEGYPLCFAGRRRGTGSGRMVERHVQHHEGGAQSNRD